MVAARILPFVRAKGFLALAALLAGAPALAQSAAITASNPATLNQANLRSATVSVTLTGTTYEATADASHLHLATDVPGLTIYSVGFNSGRTVATLRLHYDGSDFDTAATIAVTVAAAGTAHSAALTTAPQAVTPARWVNVSEESVALTEGGSNGSYTVVLESAPTGDVTVTVTSDYGKVTVDTDATPLVRTLTFTTQNWNTAQTVTVSPVDDDSGRDELAWVTNVATGGGYASSTAANRTVRVTVDDDEETGIDYDMDDDRLIEIDSLAKLNAVRWGNMNGYGSFDGRYTAVFTDRGHFSFGCPDTSGGGLADLCHGYELTKDLDFDTDGDGATHVNGVGDPDDDYYNGGLGWQAIGSTGGTQNQYRGRFEGNGHVIHNLFINRPEGVQALFSWTAGEARFVAVGMRNVYVNAGRQNGALVGYHEGRIAAAWSSGSVRGTDLVGGLVGGARSGSRIVASYSTASVECTSPTGLWAGGLAGGHLDSASISASYSTGAVTGDCPASAKGGLAKVGGSATVSASYWDATASGFPDDADTTPPEGLSTSALQTPIAYGAGATDIYATWDDYDVNDDGRIDADDDAWDFGRSNQYPSLKYGVPPMPMPEEASDVPTEVRAETRAQSLFVTWRAVAGATAYRVQWRQSGQAWSSSRQAETTETRYEITGLSGGDYEVRVLAVIGGAVGEPSAATQGEVGTPGNRPPRALEIADVELDIDETAEVDLHAAFEDPDGDPLRYSVSVDGDAVEARVSGATLRLRATLAGEATVTATATDPDGQSASASFTAQVGAALSLRGSPAAPEGGVVALQAELNRPLASDVEVDWRIAVDDDPATADADAADFAAWAGTATFAAGETRAQIAVAVLDDNAIEPARERFAIELVQPEDRNVGLSARTWRVVGSVQEGVCDRTPAVRDELSRNWRACHWPRPLDLAQLATLNLSARRIDALRPNDLLGLAALERLDLRGNALAALPENLLANTPRLRTLDLSDNALETLPESLFAGLGRLREVSAADNPGAPFALAVALVRTDARPWAPGPATVSAHIALGAPFALSAPLAASPTPSAETNLPTTVVVAAGETTGTAFAAAQVAGSPLTLHTDAAPMPTTQCNGLPCLRGFETMPGSPLTLFHRPPQALAAPTPDLLLGGDTLRLPLASLIALGDAPDAMRWEASSSDESVANARIVGADLLVEPELFGEGTAQITLTATDAFGLEATVRFEVQVEFHWPSGPVRGWRTTLSGASEDAATQAQ